MENPHVYTRFIECNASLSCNLSFSVLSEEYRDVLRYVTAVVEQHQKDLIPGTPQLNMCDLAVMVRWLLLSVDAVLSVQRVTHLSKHLLLQIWFNIRQESSWWNQLVLNKPLMTSNVMSKPGFVKTSKFCIYMWMSLWCLANVVLCNYPLKPSI